jgi:pimeloyl-ACP methyl ester carboxylesterase
MTVIGHSYGSTTTGHAATDHGLDVDDIVLVGSPGPGDDAKNAGDLGVGEDHVWVGTNSSDPVAMLGDMGWVNGGNVDLGLGNDPAEDSFGANRFQAEATDRSGWVSMGDHSKYWDHNSESLSNISHIVTGDYDQVQEAEHKYDPWYAEPQDPEADRDPTTVKTRN